MAEKNKTMKKNSFWETSWHEVLDEDGHATSWSHDLLRGTRHKRLYPSFKHTHTLDRLCKVSKRQYNSDEETAPAQIFREITITTNLS